MLGAFVSGVGCKFGAIGGTARFDVRCFFLGEFGLRGSLIFGSIELRFFLTLLFLLFLVLSLFLLGFFLFGEIGLGSGVTLFGFLFFIEFGAADECICFSVIGSFLVLGFNEFGGENNSLFLAQFHFRANRLRRSGSSELGFANLSRSGKRRGSLFFRMILLARGFRFRASFRENPAREATRKAAGNIAPSRARSRDGGTRSARRARSGFFDFRTSLR